MEGRTWRKMFDGFADAARLSGLKQISRRGSRGAGITDLAMDIDDPLAAILRR